MVKKKLSEQIIERLRAFTEKLERGEPITATRVSRIQTPDGPKYKRRTVQLQPKQT